MGVILGNKKHWAAVKERVRGHLEETLVLPIDICVYVYNPYRGYIIVMPFKAMWLKIQFWGLGSKIPRVLGWGLS